MNEGGRWVRKLTSKQLLEWVMANTVQAAEDALTEWAARIVKLRVTFYFQCSYVG